MDKKEFARLLMDRLDAVDDADWYEALVCAALDETNGDYALSLQLADEALEEEEGYNELKAAMTELP